MRYSYRYGMWDRDWYRSWYTHGVRTWYLYGDGLGDRHGVGFGHRHWVRLGNSHRDGTVHCDRYWLRDVHGSSYAKCLN